MKTLNRVVWSEGMYLGPHHFQTQAAYFDSALEFIQSALWTAPSGFLHCQLDYDAIRNGDVALTEARGIFPDGSAFAIPDDDPRPEPRPVLDQFSATADRLDVYLAVPLIQPNSKNTALETQEQRPSLRYVAQQQIVGDETTGRDSKPVSLARKNTRLLFGGEMDERFAGLPVARVMRDTAGRLGYDERFIPPCLRISASPRLMELAQGLVRSLEDRVRTLAGLTKGTAGGSAYSPEQVANFWFAHSLNSSLAPLEQLCFAKHGHPEELYVALTELAGALCTFSLDSSPRTLPRYDHLHLDETFEALETHIRRHLEVVMPTNCVSIALRPQGNGFYEGDVLDDRCLGPCRWVLSIRTPMGQAVAIAGVPKLVKICSARFVPELVKRALAGLPLNHMPVPPAAVAPRADFEYFRMERAGPAWEDIVRTKKVGLFVPPEFGSAETQLQVVLDS